MRSTLLLAFIALSGCQYFNGGEDPGRVCTADFRMIGVTVVDAANQPVEGAEVDVIRSATGKSIVCDGEERHGCVVPGDGRGYVLRPPESLPSGARVCIT